MEVEPEVVDVVFAFAMNHMPSWQGQVIMSATTIHGKQRHEHSWQQLSMFSWSSLARPGPFSRALAHIWNHIWFNRNNGKTIDICIFFLHFFLFCVYSIFFVRCVFIWLPLIWHDNNSFIWRGDTYRWWNGRPLAG